MRCTPLIVLLCLCLTFFANLLHAQEICSNGIDDDGDGFIDCFDNKCSQNAACDGSVFGNSTCDAKPDNIRSFQMMLKAKSSPNQTNHACRVIAGDIDGDGQPELVSTYFYFDNINVTESKINVFNTSVSGTLLPLKKSINVNLAANEAASYEDIAMADIDGDKCAEIFVVTRNYKTGPNYKIVAYDCNGNLKWATPISFTITPGLMGLADFDHDGLVELYSRTQIFDAHTGTLLGYHNMDDVNTGIHAGVDKGWGMNSNASIAVDIISSNPGLELVAGCRIYGVTINRVAMTATLTLLKEYPQYATRTGSLDSNPTSIADFNQDGYLDVLAAGSAGTYDNNTTIFFWDVQHDNVKKYIDTGGYVNGWHYGAGRINIADIDGDTLMNATYVSGEYLYSLKEGTTALELLWREPINELSSGFTGCTVFDFNGDGKSEIVYRDEDFLTIYETDINGVLTKKAMQTCASRSHHEQPIVVDIDGDGSTEICVTCSTAPNTRGRDLKFWDEAEVRVYESANDPWMPSRTVWNQHGYFVTNVNDDLTIPKYQQPQHLIYAKNAPCRNNGSSRPLNAFQNQATRLNASGCPVFPAPNLSIVPFDASNLIDYEPFNCVAENFQVTFKFTNEGEAKLYGAINVSFYDGDPRQLPPVATHLGTKSVFSNVMQPGETITATASIKNPGHAFDLYIVVNDDGTTLPLDISTQTDHITECDYDNVVDAAIIPDQVPLVSELVQANVTCLTGPGETQSLDNGSLKAYISMGDKKDSTQFNFYWSNGAAAKPVASVDYIGYAYTNLGSGVYTVYAAHKTIECISDTVSIVVEEASSQVDAKVAIEKIFDDAENPNGALKAIVNDTDNDGVGDPEDHFSYSWYRTEEIFVGEALGTSHTLAGLGEGDYSVYVSDKNKNCFDLANATITFKETILGPDEKVGIDGITMYPNPGTDGFNIAIDNGYVGDVQLQLQSILGDEVETNFVGYKGASMLEVPVDSSKLESGVYVLKISLGKRTVVYMKWIKR